MQPSTGLIQCQWWGFTALQRSTSLHFFHYIVYLSAFRQSLVFEISADSVTWVRRGCGITSDGPWGCRCFFFWSNTFAIFRQDLPQYTEKNIRLIRVTGCQSFHVCLMCQWQLGAGCHLFDTLCSFQRLNKKVMLEKAGECRSWFALNVLIWGRSVFVFLNLI